MEPPCTTLEGIPEEVIPELLEVEAANEPIPEVVPTLETAEEASSHFMSLDLAASPEPPPEQYPEMGEPDMVGETVWEKPANYDEGTSVSEEFLRKGTKARHLQKATAKDSLRQ